MAVQLLSQLIKPLMSNNAGMKACLTQAPLVSYKYLDAQYC